MEREEEVVEEQRKRMIDERCLQIVRWGEHSCRILGIVGRRYKLWWSEK